jgi:hypothetical protein
VRQILRVWSCLNPAVPNSTLFHEEKKPVKLMRLDEVEKFMDLEKVLEVGMNGICAKRTWQRDLCKWAPGR